MKMKVFAVYDVKAAYYKNPFMMRTEAEALRSFADVAGDIKTEIGLHPEDFCLFCLAEFDNDKGVYVNEKAPRSLGLAIEVVKPNTKVNGKLEVAE